MANRFSRFLAHTAAKILGDAFISEALSVREANVYAAAGTGQDERDTKKLSGKELYAAYHNKPFVKPIVEIYLSFLLAGGGFSIKADKDEVEKELNHFWDSARVKRDQKRAAREAITTGNTYLGVTGAGFGDNFVEEAGKGSLEEGTSLVVFGHEETTVHFDPFLNRPTKFEIITFISPEKGETKTKSGRYEITLTDEEITVKSPNERKGKSVSHPYGRPPLVQVAENQMLKEVYGRGAIDRALFNRIEDYEMTLEKAVAWAKYHGAPILGVFGLRDPQAYLDNLKDKAWHPGKIMGFGKDQEAKFIESAHGIEHFIELAKLLYHQIVVESRVPEFLFGVHMKSAQASTKEQLVNILKANDERRDTWTVAIQDINRILQIKTRGKAVPTDVLWGPAELSSMKERAEVIALLVGLKAMSRKTAMQQFPEMIQLIDQELEQIQQEEKSEELSPYKASDFVVERVSKLIQLMEQAKRGDKFAQKLREILGVDKEAA